nr:mucin-like protein [Lytechinus pictus]
MIYWTWITFNITRKKGKGHRGAEQDVLARFHCCGFAGGRYCNLYESRRPQAHCWGYIPPRFGWFWGDPHISSIDGMKYTFNGLGEYMLLSYSHGDPFVLQSRTGKAYNNSKPVEHGTVFTGFAATQSITKVEFQLNDNKTEMKILVNGSSINMTAFLEDGYDSLDQTFILSSEGSDNETESEDEIKVTALFQPDGYPSTSFTVTFKNAILDIGVMVPSEYAEHGTGRGLLGNVNGNKSDDFLLRNGTILTDPPGRNLTDREIFQFGQSWQISEDESLFEYGDRDWSSYNPSNYTPIFQDDLLALDPVRTAAAREACGENEACLFDYLAVNPDMGQQTMSTEDQLDNDLQSLDNFPPNITSVTEITETDALQDDDVLLMQVDVNVTLKIIADDPNEGDAVDFTFNSTAPDGASINSDGIFTWIPPNLNVTSIEIIATDNRDAQTSIQYKVLICECQNDGVCDFEDQAEGHDLNANGFAVVTCNCTDGWSGDHCDVDYDACEGSGPCYEGVICYDEPPSSDEEYRCGPCPPQLTGNGSNCFDFNECDGVSNDCEQNCENILGSYKCSCDPRFVLNLDQRSCDELSECDEALMISSGSENCTCDYGFQLENGTCSDFDECGASVDECQSGISTCNNFPGDYNCTCLPGYKNVSPKECKDIDECDLMMDDCNTTNNLVCMNTQGNFSCVCRENTFSIDGTCENALTLSLGIGFTFISGFGIELNPEVIESEETQSKLAQDMFLYLNASSHLSDGTLLALSVQNYSLPGSYALVFFRVDLTDGTPLNSSSLEKIFVELLPDSRLIEPSHIVRPEDINECELSEDACRNGECTNTDGGFYCTCDEGFYLGMGNDSCLDINECLGVHDCNQICVNSPGNYSCSCQPGFVLLDDRVSCNEIDECASDPCQNGATCTDEINMYKCTCAPGYNGTNCATVDNSYLI